MRPDQIVSDETARARIARLKEENSRLQRALDAAKLTAEIERKRAEAAQEAAARAWRIAGSR